VAPAPLAHVAEYCVNAQRTGTLRDFAFLEKWQGLPEVLYARPLVEPGSKVGGRVLRLQCDRGPGLRCA